MKIYSGEFLSIVLIFPGLFAVTLLIEGIYKLRHYNWMGIVSLVAGTVLLVMLGLSYMYFSHKL